MNRTFIAAFSELTGTFFLTLAALSVPAPFTPVAVGLVLLVFVYVIGGISGCHLNPAVTVGLVSSRQFPLIEGAFFVIAQIIGALIASFLVSQRIIGQWGDYQASHIAGEFIAFGVLILTVAAVTEKRVTSASSGIAVGAALTAGLWISGGVLNPAIAIAMGLGKTTAIWAPLVSGILFSLLFSFLKKGSPPKVE